jgi:hypothetical protein
MAAGGMVAVKPSGITNIETAHELAQVRLDRLHAHVKMVIHQDIEKQYDTVNTKGLTEDFEKSMSIIFIQENLLTLVPATYYMIICSWILDA